MSDQSFLPGQRWVSNTEPELGLGIVQSIDFRRVTLFYPVADESRTYATKNAPLTRVMFTAGDKIRDMTEVEYTVVSRHEDSGCFIYTAADNGGQQATISEVQLDSRIQFSKPQDRLFAGQIDSNQHFELRLDALERLHEHRASPAFGFVGARVQLLAHQQYVAHQITRNPTPRALLADEVGLGKTIEAGLVLHHLLLSERAKRLLVVVPESLLHQWLVEMLRRFNLNFTLLDEERCEALQESGHGNPFSSTQLALVSLDFIAGDETRIQEVVDAKFDLCVIDEAHRLVTDQLDNERYSAAERLAGAIPGMLLLTATPEQFGEQSHWARLKLLDPERFHDYAAYQSEQLRYRDVGELITLLDSSGAEALREPETTARICALVGEETFDHSVQLGDGTEAVALDKLVNTIVDRHGTGRLQFRNSRRAVDGFAERIGISHELDPPDGWTELTHDADITQCLRPETLIGQTWLSEDPRVAWLIQWLKSDPNEKALLITSQADTAAELEEHLRLRHGIRSAVFHEHMSLIVRDRAAAYFAESDQDGAQVLICSEIGSEGRNFQFCKRLVMFDLPLNPDLLEQRIGRLDRIGQRYTVEVHVPCYTNSAQQLLYRWYDEGLNALGEPCAAGPLIHQRLGEQLRVCLTNTSEISRFEALLTQTIDQVKTIAEALDQGRDRVLERNSCRQPQANQLVDQVIDAEQRHTLASFMERAFDCIGVNQQIDGHSVILKPGDHLLEAGIVNLPEDGATATYSREYALSREDVLFLTWEHPMVGDVIDSILSGGIGNTALCALRDSGLRPATVLLEAIYVPHCAAPKALQVQRFLAQSSMRVLMDSQGRDNAEQFPSSALQGSIQYVAQRTAQEIVRRVREQIGQLIEYAQDHVAQASVPSIIEARSAANAYFESELARSRSLATLNADADRGVIQHLEQTQVALDEHLSQTTYRIDAIRVLLAT